MKKIVSTNSQYIARKSLNKEGRKPRTKAPKIQHLVTLCVLQHTQRIDALKNEEDAEHAKLLTNRMKKAKEKQEGFPRDAGCPC